MSPGRDIARWCRVDPATGAPRSRDRMHAGPQASDTVSANQGTKCSMSKVPLLRNSCRES